MEKPDAYTLEELAEAFGLTPRTARHYIENLLPPHHKKGRGKLARYGKDTWNCFAFIKKVRKQSGFTSEQISNVLASLDQAQIDRVAEGREDLRVVTWPSEPAIERYSLKPRLQRASERASKRKLFDKLRPERAEMLEPRVMERRISNHVLHREAAAPPSWKTLYADDQLRITFKGEASREQREQVDLAAKLILKILSGSG